MGIGPAVGTWLGQLHARGVFAAAASVIELGPSEFTWPKRSLPRFIEDLAGDPAQTAAFLQDLDDKAGQSHMSNAASFYGLLGIDDYNSMDYGDSSATLKHNLNLPLETDLRFDVVADFGTLEHVFNIGEGFRTVHNLLPRGGVALHQLPTYGGYYHGFYNINSVMYRSLIHANDYEVIDFLYVHDVQLEDDRAGKALTPRFEDISRSEVRRQTIKFLFNYFRSLTSSRERTSSQIFLAYRKTGDQPFAYPHQINKYAIDERTELWRHAAPSGK